MHQPELPGLDGQRTHRRESSALSVPGPAGRYAALLADHQRLLDRVSRQRERLRRLEEEVRARGARMAAVVEPLRDRLLALDAEVHAVFGELLAPGRLSKAARRQVRALYDFLQDQEVLSPAASRSRPTPEAAPPPRLDQRNEKRPAPQTGLRALFLDLASVLHPDKAEGAADQAARTEAMKEVNQAYRDRDLARLLELERAWALGGQATPVSPDDLERRCQALERTNQELRAQIKHLARQEKELRRSDLAHLVHLGEALRAEIDPLAALEAEGREQIEKLTKVRDLVRRFRDGEISLDELLAGPDASTEEAMELEELDELEELAALLAQLERHGRSAAPLRGGTRRRRRR